MSRELLLLARVLETESAVHAALAIEYGDNWNRANDHLDAVTDDSAGAYLEASDYLDSIHGGRASLSDVRLEVCPECGSPDVEWEDWVHVESGEPTGTGTGSSNAVWCPDCEDNYKGTKTVTLETMTEMQAAHAAGKEGTE